MTVATRPPSARWPVPVADTWHSGPLAGRDQETALLQRALDALIAGAPPTVEIAGEPGIGKTRLLAELTRLAQARGIPLVTGRAPRSGRALRAVRDRRLSANPFVLAVDDLHHADDQTVDLVEELLFGAAPAAMLVLAHRPRQSPARLQRAFDDAPGLIRLPLAPLTSTETSTLVPAQVARVWHHTLYEQSGGNPFYLKALLRFPPPYLTGGDVEVGELGPAVRAAVADELRALTPATRLAAYAAAVVDDQVEPAVLAEVAGLTGPELYAAIDELVGRDILRPISGTGRFRFRHAVLRHAVYHGSGSGWRLDAHTRAAGLLDRRHASPVVRAAHLARVGNVGDVTAVRVLTDAAAAVLHHRPATAAQWLRAALRLAVTGTVSDGERAAIRWRLCRALSRTGQPHESREILAETLRAVPDGPDRVEVVAFAAQLERYLRRPAQARSIVHTGLTAAGAAAVDPTLALELACADLSRRRAAQSRAHARYVLATARRGGDRAVAAGVAVVADCLAGDLPGAAEQALHAVRRLDELPDCELAQRVDAGLWVGVGLVLLDRPQAALRHLERAAEIGAERGEHLLSAYLLACRAVALRAVGRLAAAATSADAAVDLASAAGSPELWTMTATVRRWVAVWTGEPAQPAAGTPDQPDDPGEPDLFATWERAMLAEARFAAGDHHGCVALLTGGDQPDPDRIDPWSGVGWCELLTRAAARAGRYDDADHWAGRAESFAEQLATGGRSAVARLARAQALLPRDPAAAATAALDAAGALARSGLVLEAARAGAVAGSALAAAGELDRAIDELEQARESFASCGARRLARQVAADRRRIGSRLPRGNRPVHGVDALTRREREVASLVGIGLTNRQVAARLFVTEKTVEMHLSHVFAKLGVPNRAGVARELGRSGAQR